MGNPYSARDGQDINQDSEFRDGPNTLPLLTEEEEEEEEERSVQSDGRTAPDSGRRKVKGRKVVF